MPAPPMSQTLRRLPHVRCGTGEGGRSSPEVRGVTVVDASNAPARPSSLPVQSDDSVYSRRRAVCLHRSQILTRGVSRRSTAPGSRRPCSNARSSIARRAPRARLPADGSSSARTCAGMPRLPCLRRRVAIISCRRCGLCCELGARSSGALGRRTRETCAHTGGPRVFVVRSAGRLLLTRESLRVRLLVPRRSPVRPGAAATVDRTGASGLRARAASRSAHGTR